ncbi:MAG: hypothetical protein KDA96_00620 [Planctomycetaceae bacterium]|nr:hypothetical protein [Planctomycetaceae bacterium]
MQCRLSVRLVIRSDFHIGTGSGQGRIVDARILTDPGGCPILPGSSLKGLARAQAEVRILPVFSDYEGAADLVFGKPGGPRGCFHFGEARTESSPPVTLIARSARDRNSGCTREGSLFFGEVAPAQILNAVVEADDLPDDESGMKAIILLALSLRSIHAIGASRRRGLGACSVQVTFESPEPLKGKQLDGDKSADWLLRLIEDPRFETTTASVASPVSGTPVNDADEWCALPLFAEALTPLVFSADRGTENLISTLDYIPGSSLRGAFASWMLRSGFAAEEAEFQDLIVGEQIQFGPLYPLDSFWEHRQTMPVPVPLSFVECKYEPGERRSLSLESGHGMTDRHCASPSTCHCGEAMTPSEGWLTIRQPATSAAVSEFRTWKSPTQTTLRTAINSQTTNRASEGDLYATESLHTGTWFAGYLWARTAVAEWIRTRFIGRNTLIRVGKSLTRGHGQLRLWTVSAPGTEPPASDRLYPYLFAPGCRHSDVPASEFTMFCYSDVIALDELLNPISQLDHSSGAEILWKLLGQAGTPPFIISAAFVRTCRIGGFNGIPQLPRVVDRAIAAGSTWKCEWLPKAGDSEKQTAWNLLQDAQEFGIGLRRGEGFGRILLDPPFHAARAEQNLSSDGPPHFTVVADCSLPTTSACPTCVTSRLAIARKGTTTLARHAKKCRFDVRASAGRILSQVAEHVSPGDSLEDLLQGLRSRKTPTPAGKSDTTRGALTDFLTYVREKVDSIDLKSLAEALQKLSETSE